MENTTAPVASKPKQKGWSDEEYNALHKALKTRRQLEKDNSLQPLRDAKLWGLMSQELKSKGIDRKPDGCRMYWSRYGRVRSGFDESAIKRVLKASCVQKSKAKREATRKVMEANKIMIKIKDPNHPQNSTSPSSLSAQGPTSAAETGTDIRGGIGTLAEAQNSVHNNFNGVLSETARESLLDKQVAKTPMTEVNVPNGSGLLNRRKHANRVATFETGFGLGLSLGLGLSAQASNHPVLDSPNGFSTLTERKHPHPINSAGLGDKAELDSSETKHTQGMHSPTPSTTTGSPHDSPPMPGHIAPISRSVVTPPPTPTLAHEEWANLGKALRAHLSATSGSKSAAPITTSRRRILPFEQRARINKPYGPAGHEIHSKKKK